MLVANWTVNGHRSIKSMRASVANLRRHFGNDKALAITVTRAEAYKAARLAEGAAGGTINHELAMLRRMFSLAKEANLIPNPPTIKMLSLNNARQGFCDPSDFARLLATLPEHLQVIVEFLYLTSWRVGEARTLEWGDIDLPNRAIRLRAEHSKNRHARVVKLSGRLLEVVEHAATSRRSNCLNVFHHNGKPLVDFRRSWENATQAAGLNGLLLHDLRRSGVRNMVRAGVSESVAMKISGHRTRTTFERYNIVSEGDLDAAAEKLDAYLDRKVQEPAKVTSIHAGRSTPIRRAM
jgi:integrase